MLHGVKGISSAFSVFTNIWFIKDNNGWFSSVGKVLYVIDSVGNSIVKLLNLIWVRNFSNVIDPSYERSCFKRIDYANLAKSLTDINGEVGLKSMLGSYIPDCKRYG
jgi:hypothetical protein